MFSIQANQQFSGVTRRRTIADGGGSELLERLEQTKVRFCEDAKELAEFYGRTKIDRIYRETMKTVPKVKRGKQANRDWNATLLALYDAVARDMPDEIKSIPRIIADSLKYNNPKQAPSLTTHIRRLVTGRDHARRLFKNTFSSSDIAFS
jgi:hypothetical protein